MRVRACVLIMVHSSPNQAIRETKQHPKGTPPAVLSLYILPSPRCSAHPPDGGRICKPHLPPPSTTIFRLNPLVLGTDLFQSSRGDPGRGLPGRSWRCVSFRSALRAPTRKATVWRRLVTEGGAGDGRAGCLILTRSCLSRGARSGRADGKPLPARVAHWDRRGSKGIFLRQLRHIPRRRYPEFSYLYLSEVHP